MSVPEPIEITPSPDSCPEKRLWAAVIATVITDAERGFQRMKTGMKRSPAYSYSDNYLLRDALTHLQTPWFETICTFIDIHPDWIYKNIQARAKKHGLSLKGLRENQCHVIKTS